uniref:Mediator of RNA polymerase II transcription subunit 15 n=1 Tax=Electrophorus electricus TaxID=8005 RepID=A0A4W4G399_ELEEL
MEVPGPDNDWRSPGFRQKVVAQIEEAMRKAGTAHSKSSNDMETHVFTKAKSREEYLSLVARLIIHFRDIHKKAQGGPDPMNALQTLTGVSAGGPGAVGMGPRPPGAPMGGMGTMGQIQMSQHVMQGVAGNQPGGKLTSAGTSGPTGQMQMQMVQQQQQQQQQSIQFQQFQAQQQTTMQAQPPTAMQQNALQQQQFQAQQLKLQQQLQQQQQQQQQHPSQALQHQNQQQQAQAQQQQAQAQQQQQQNQVRKDYMQINAIGFNNDNLKIILNLKYTMESLCCACWSAGNPSSVMSPAGSSQSEDQLYMDTLKQLSKYIEPLRRMINKIDKNEDRKKDLSKMKSLLNILTDPNTRCPLKTLQKCEIALEKLKNDMAVPTPPPPPVPCTKKQYLCQPLLDAVLANIRSPVFNHSLYRTFAPAMTAIHGPPIIGPIIPTRKRKYEEDDRQTIPNILQGEVARLSSKFLVNLDPSFCSNNGTVHLICKLDDKNLPSVPPLQLSIPADYPDQSPQWDNDSQQYEANPFLQTVHKTMTSKLLQLPDKHSVTALLNTWAQSVRQTCLSAA